MSGAAPPNEPFVNPYAGHRLLDAREKQVLGEYARLAATMKRDIRILERKMGLVLTLFKASVWSLVQSHEDDEGTSQDQL